MFRLVDVAIPPPLERRQARLPSPPSALRALPVVLAGLTSLAGVSLARAAEGDGVPSVVQRGPEMVVTAARLAQPVNESLSDVRVITAEDLAGAGQMSLAEILRQYGGIETSTTGGAGQPVSLSIRGASTAQTLVLIDGLRLGSATAGTTALEHIPVNQIERIEIVAGPVSGLYGSDAIGGAIQIFTRQAGAQPASQLSLGLGSYGTRRIDAAHSERDGAIDWSMAAGAQSTTGFSATNASAGPFFYNQNIDPHRNSNLSARLGWQWADGHHIGVSVLDSFAVTYYSAGPGPEQRNRQRLSQYAFTSTDQLLPGWSSQLKIGSSRDHYADEGQYSDYFETEQHQASWQNTVQVPTGQVVAGVDYLQDRVLSDTPFTVTARDNRAAYVGYTGAIDAHSFGANLRHDDNQQFGGANSGALAYGYRLSPQARVRASYGAGFRAPSFNDLYYPGSANPLLKPEHSRSTEAGADLDFAGQHVSLTAFENRIHDKILFVYTDPVNFLGQPLNVSAARTRGLELGWHTELGGTRLEARGTLQDPVNLDSGNRLPRNATVFGTARASRTIAGYDVALEAQGSGARFDSLTQASERRMGGYTLFNLAVAHALGTAWQADLRWNNLLAHRYTQAYGYNTPGSNLMGTLTWRAP